MTVVTVTDLHTSENPRARLSIAASVARVRAGTDLQRLIVRCPDRQTNGIRTLTLDDVAGLLRRHGRIREIGVTDGGTIVASADLCERRGEIAVWTGQAIGKWHPSDVTTKGLGGSETAAVRLAEQLAAMGYLVTLYGDFASQGLAGDVALKHYGALDPSRPLDALVSLRDARLFEHRPNARACILWLEDLAPAEGLTRRRAANLDRIVAVTSWHKGQVQRAYPWLDPAKVAAGRNGIVTEWFATQPAPERNLRVVYSSSPDRGGDIVLECWPEIRKQVPDAELLLTYPRWFELVAETWPEATQHRERLRELVKQPGVKRLDQGMGQRALANLMRSSLVWVNPGYYTPGRQKFCETSCISAMEAQAAGCVVVASNWGAVTETVQYGTLIDGDPSELPRTDLVQIEGEGGHPAYVEVQVGGAWRRAFVDAVVRGLTDPVAQAAAQECGPEMMRGMDWRGAAEQLAAMFPAPAALEANYGAIRDPSSGEGRQTRAIAEERHGANSSPEPQRKAAP